MIQNNLKNIFENINQGSVLAFYQKKWYLQLIPFFTREVKKEFAPQHCGICYEIKKCRHKLWQRSNRPERRASSLPPPHPPMAVLTKQEAIYLKNQMQSFAYNFD